MHALLLSSLLTVLSAQPEAEVLSLRLPREVPDHLELTLPLGGGMRSVSLIRESIRGPGLSIERGAASMGAGIHPLPVSTYSGQVEGLIRSHVAASIRDGKLRALVWPGPNEEPWIVAPASDLGDDPWSVEHLVAPARSFAGTDLAGQAWCGSQAGGLLAGAPSPVPAPQAGSGTQVVDIGLECDYEYFVNAGGTVQAAAQTMEETLFFASSIYEVTFDVRFALVLVHVWDSEPDPFSGSGGFDTHYQELRSHFLSDHGTLDCDYLHAFTGQQYEGSIAGKNFGGACQGFDLAPHGSVVEQLIFPTRVLISAHEIGHAFGASHCDSGGCFSDCGIMSSIASNEYFFGSCSQAAISAFGGNCFGGGPGTVPPVLTATSPSTLQAFDIAFQDPQLTISGTGLEYANAAEVAGEVLDLGHGLHPVDAQSVLVSSPVDVGQLGSVDVRVRNGGGWSNALSVTVTATEPPRLDTSLEFYPGVSFAWTVGGQPNHTYRILYGLDPSRVMDQGFQKLANPDFTITTSLDAAGLDVHSEIIPAGWSGQPFYTQILTVDEAASSSPVLSSRSSRSCRLRAVRDVPVLCNPAHG